MKGGRTALYFVGIPLLCWALSGCGVTGMDVAIIAVKTAIAAADASRPMTDSEEHYVERAVAARILATYPLLRDQGLNTYLNLVGQALARRSTRPYTFKGYHFAALDSHEPNAFACPGGMIFVTRGLLALCENEDELAAVLAHEVSHLAHKDGINSISQARWTSVLILLGKEAVTRAGVPAKLLTLFGESVEDVFRTLVVNGYSRSAEEEADKEAIKILAETGYAPGALVSLLGKMETLSKDRAGLLSTHPPTKERLDSVRTLCGDLGTGELHAARIQRFNDILGKPIQQGATR
jgi:predicted Zn-dependent protease